MSSMKSISAVVLTVLLAALLFACSSSDPKSLIKEGHDALGSNDSTKAQSKFSEALKGLKPGQRITGTIRKLGDSFLVENIHRRRP